MAKSRWEIIAELRKADENYVRPKRNKTQPLPTKKQKIAARLEKKRLKRREKRQRAKERKKNWPLSDGNLRFLPYKDYLKTCWWKFRREQKIKSVGGACERCAKRRSLQVHHKTYERLGMERDDDLEVVCKGCHQHIHQDDIEARMHLRSIMSETA